MWRPTKGDKAAAMKVLLRDDGPSVHVPERSGKRIPFAGLSPSVDSSTGAASRRPIARRSPEKVFQSRRSFCLSDSGLFAPSAFLIKHSRDRNARRNLSRRIFTSATTITPRQEIASLGRRIVPTLTRGLINGAGSSFTIMAMRVSRTLRRHGVKQMPDRCAFN